MDEKGKNGIIVDGRICIGWKWFDNIPLEGQVVIIGLCILFWVLVLVPKEKGSNFSEENERIICSEGMSYVMNTPTSIMDVSNKSQSYFTVSYNRPSDGKYFIHKCKVVGNRLVWANSLTSRWMDSDQDSVITFNIVNGYVEFQEKFK